MNNTKKIKKFFQIFGVAFLIGCIIASVLYAQGRLKGKNSNKNEKEVKTEINTTEKNSSEAKKAKVTSDKEANDQTASNKATSDKTASDKESSDKTISDQVASNGKIVCIDPGHQTKANSSKEPIGPGASTTKAKVTGGTTGKFTGCTEYELNLEVSLKLRDELKKRGYTVYLTRETNDVDISNKERADYAASVKADIFIRIHANGADSSATNGALALAPSQNNPYVARLSNESQRLSKNMVDAYCNETGIKNLGVVGSNDMSGINWSTMPVTIFEMGFMSNQSDDTKMADPAFQDKMAQGMANGIDVYFGR